MDLMTLLGDLEERLTRLDEAGIRHLSIAPADPAVAADPSALGFDASLRRGE